VFGNNGVMAASRFAERQRPGYRFDRSHHQVQDKDGAVLMVPPAEH
jgi:hypothetical protein